MSTVFDLAARQVSADQALRALFETHLQHLDKDRCQDYLHAFGLPAEVTWNDAAGKTWSLWDRVRWFGMNHPQGLKSLSLFTHLFQQQPDLPWGKAPQGASARARGSLVGGRSSPRLSPRQHG